MKPDMYMFPLARPGSKTDQATGAAVDSLEVKPLIDIVFAVGDIVENVTRTRYDQVL